MGHAATGGVGRGQNLDAAFCHKTLTFPLPTDADRPAKFFQQIICCSRFHHLHSFGIPSSGRGVSLHTGSGSGASKDLCTFVAF